MTLFDGDQATVLEFLGSPGAHLGAPVDRIDTHSAVIFLAGQRAYKVKRAVRFDYLDFSTLDRRKACCEAEVRLNRRTAPTLYRSVMPVTREADGRLMLGGHGTPVEWVIEMERFDQEALLDRLAAAGRLDLSLAEKVADDIGAFHLLAEHRPDHGGQAAMEWVIQGNVAGLAQYGRGIVDAALCERLADESTRELARQAECLETRRRNGFVMSWRPSSRQHRPAE